MSHGANTTAQKAAGRITELLTGHSVPHPPIQTIAAIVEEYIFEERQRIERKLIEMARHARRAKQEEISAAYTDAAAIAIGKAVPWQRRKKVCAWSPDEQRIAIAEAWGFEPGTINRESWLGYCDPIHAETLYQLDCDVEDSVEKPNHILAKVPNFIGDLNAMRLAEETLTAGEQIEYARRLHDATKSHRHYLHVDFDVAHSTARQRADAFVAVKKLLPPPLPPPKT